MEENHPLDALPQEIKLNIFSRLPVESVLGCKLVCRSWRSDLLQFHATNATYFANLHLRNHYGHGVLVKQQRHKPFEHYRDGFDSETMCFVGFQGYNTKNPWYLEYYEDSSDTISTDKPPNYRIRKMNLELPGDVDGLPVGSDNGLICLRVRTKYKGIGKYSFTPQEPAYVCNPITREFVNLPRLLIDEKKSIGGVHIVYGFGYHPITNEYKVVRICFVGPKNSTIEGQIEVYTLGSGSGWRKAGETNHYLCPMGHPVGVYVNGALHWLCDESTNILAFDLEDEEFHLLDAPTTQSHQRRLFVNRRCLCIEYHTDEFLDFWFLKKIEEEDPSRSYQMNDQYYKSWSWNRELRVPWTKGVLSMCWSAFYVTKRGETLVHDGERSVYYFSNQGTKTSKRIMEFNNGFTYHSISHINSFVSLEALGERNVKKLEPEGSAYISISSKPDE